VGATGLQATDGPTWNGTVLSVGPAGDGTGTVQAGVVEVWGANRKIQLTSTAARLGASIPIAWSNVSGADGVLFTSVSRVSDGVVGIGTGASGSVDGTLQAGIIDVTAPLATDIPLDIELAATPSANAFQVSSNGTSSGDVFKIDSAGDVTVSGVLSAGQGWSASQSLGGTVTAVEQTLIGGGTSGGAYCTVIGALASAPGTNWLTNGIAIGRGATAGADRIALNANCTAGNQFVAGGQYCDIQDVYFGRGVIDATPGTTTYRATANSTTNGDGGDLRLQGGLPDGSGSYGDLVLQPDGGDVVVTGDITTSGAITVSVPTLTDTGLVLQSTDDNGTNPIAEIRNAAGTVLGGFGQMTATRTALFFGANQYSDYIEQISAAGGLMMKGDHGVRILNNASTTVAQFGGYNSVASTFSGQTIIDGYASAEVGLSIVQPATPSDNAFQISTNGTSAGDVFKIASDGATTLSTSDAAHYLTTSSYLLQVGGQNKFIASGIGTYISGTSSYRISSGNAGGNTVAQLGMNATSDGWKIIADGGLEIYKEGGTTGAALTAGDATFSGPVEIANPGVGNNAFQIKADNGNPGTIFNNRSANSMELQFYGSGGGSFPQFALSGSGLQGHTNVTDVVGSGVDSVLMNFYHQSSGNTADLIQFSEVSSTVKRVWIESDFSLHAEAATFSGPTIIDGFTAAQVGLSIVQPATPSGNAFQISTNGTSSGDLAYVDSTGNWWIKKALTAGPPASPVAIGYSIPSGTVPSVCPSAGDLNTGIGRAANDQLSLIAGGVEAVNLSTTAATFSGALQTALTTVTGTTHTAASESTIICDDDTAGSAITVTLPAASTCTGRTYSIKKVGSTANVIIDGSGAETIDGATTATLTTQYESLTIQCDGTTWWVI